MELRRSVTSSPTTFDDHDCLYPLLQGLCLCQETPSEALQFPSTSSHPTLAMVFNFPGLYCRSANFKWLVYKPDHNGPTHKNGSLYPMQGPSLNESYSPAMIGPCGIPPWPHIISASYQCGSQFTSWFWHEACTCWEFAHIQCWPTILREMAKLRGPIRSYSSTSIVILIFNKITGSHCSHLHNLSTRTLSMPQPGKVYSSQIMDSIPSYILPYPQIPTTLQPCNWYTTFIKLRRN